MRGPAQPAVCDHGIRWPHPCDDCDSAPPPAGYNPLAANTPTFADLCDAVRQARIRWNRAIQAKEAAEAALTSAKALVDRYDDEEDAARKALEAFIDRETEVDA